MKNVPVAPKKWWRSRTLAFFLTVFSSGGLDLVINFIEHSEVSWRSVALLLVGIGGIALRLVTKQPVK